MSSTITPNDILIDPIIPAFALDVREQFRRTKTAISRVKGNATKRPPTQYDDSSMGYSVGDFWLEPGNSRMYEAVRVDAGNAVWVPREATPPLPGNIAPGLAACYALRKIVQSYVGPLVRVVRASDSTESDIGFTDDGSFDTSTYLTFISGTTGRLITWYDQSGNAHHATATGTARPSLTPFNCFGNSPGVIFDNAISNNSQTRLLEAFTIPSSLTGLAANSLASVSLAAFGHTSRDCVLYELSPTGSNTRPVAMGQRRQDTLDALVAYAPNAAGGQGARTLLGYKPPLSPIVCGMSTGLAVTIYATERFSRTTGNVNSGTLEGGLIGGSTLFLDGVSNPYYGYTTQAAFMVFSNTITSTQYRSIAESLYQNFSVAPQRRGRIICDGDSITEGALSTYFQTWPYRMIPLLDSAFEIHNVGISGGTLVSQLSATSRWTTLYNASQGQNTVIIAAGTNDISSVGSATTLYARLQNYITAVKAAGFSIILATILPRASFNSSPTLEAIRLEYNTRLRNTWRELGAIGVIDFASDATMGSTSAPADTTLFSDGTHPVNLGYAYMAHKAAASLNSILED